MKHGFGKVLGPSLSLPLLLVLLLLGSSASLRAQWDWRPVLGKEYWGSSASSEKAVVFYYGENIRYSEDGTHWKTANAPFSLSHLTWCNGYWLGDDGKKIYRSDDLIGWEETSFRLAKNAFFISSIAWMKDRSVVIVDSRNVFESRDGLSWSKVVWKVDGYSSSDSPMAAPLTGPGGYIMGNVSDTSGLRFSSDGRLWKNVSLPSPLDLNSTGSAGDRYFVFTGDMGAGGSMGVSEDGLNWSSVFFSSHQKAPKKVVAAGVGKFSALTWDGGLLWSGDVLTWHPVEPESGPDKITSIQAFKGGFQALDQRGRIFHSDDGKTWAGDEPPAAPPGWIEKAIVHHDSFLASGEDEDGPFLIVSENGADWTRLPEPPGKFYLLVSDGGNVLVGACQSGLYWSQDDGQSWILSQAAPASWGLRRMAYGNGTFIGVSNDGQLWISSDGTAWSLSRPSVFSGASLETVLFGNGRFVIATNPASATAWKAGLYESADGVSWQKTSTAVPGTRLYFAGTAFYMEGWVKVAGVNNDVPAFWRSEDLQTWKALKWPYKDALAFPQQTYRSMIGMAAGNGAVVAATAEGPVFVSENGIDWKARAAPRAVDEFHNFQLNDILFANGTFLAVGKDALWVSQRGLPALVDNRKLLFEVGRSNVAPLRGTNKTETFAMVSPLPAGLSLKGGTLQGVPKKIGTYRAKIRLTNSVGQRDESLTLQVIDTEKPVIVKPVRKAKFFTNGKFAKLQVVARDNDRVQYVEVELWIKYRIVYSARHKFPLPGPQSKIMFKVLVPEGYTYRVVLTPIDASGNMGKATAVTVRGL